MAPDQPIEMTFALTYHALLSLHSNQLPDGNLDDFSQHAAEPVVSGEKWLINLWVWDPIFE